MVGSQTQLKLMLINKKTSGKMFKLSTILVLLSVSQLSSLTVVKLMVLNGNNSLTTQTLLESHLLHQANSPSRTPISSVNSKQLAETLLFLLLYLPILL